MLVSTAVVLAACTPQTGQNTPPSSPSTTAAPTTESADQPTATSLATPTTVASTIDSIPPVEVHGWPSTTRNPPGAYSWGGYECAGPSCPVDFVCAGTSCNAGFMHNGYGSGAVRILFEVVPERPTIDDGATAVTIAGYDGIHQRIDAQGEEWIVDVEDTTIAIRLHAEPGASQADLDEAHAIIDSIRTEPRDTDLGFRLVFTLSTNHWDSG